MANFKVIKGKRSKNLYLDFYDIFDSLSVLFDRLRDEHDLTPFEYTEMTAAGAFGWAAGARGRLALTEYQIKKSKAPGKKAKKDGRADLWIDFPQRHYSLEFKVAWWKATAKNMEKCFDLARKDAAKLDKREQDHAVGVLVAHVDEAERLDVYDEFCNHPDVALAVRIGKKKKGCCYIYMSEDTTVG